MTAAARGEPLISCLMVTLPVAARLQAFAHSLDAFCRQTYANRELVIVRDRGTAEVADDMARIVAGVGRDDIRLIDPPLPQTLGALRNISWREARGEFVCQWDDDDLYHPQRLAIQLAALRRNDARSVCLQEVMQYSPNSRELRLTNWRASPQASKPGSLLCLRDSPIRYPETGADALLGEDLIVHAQLQALGGFQTLAGAAHLYVYVSHGQNTCSAEHHRMIADRLGVSKGLLLRREAEIREGMAAFDFGPGDVTVAGPNGPAFAIPGEGNNSASYSSRSTAMSSR